MPAASCPVCSVVLGPWHGYWRDVRFEGRLLRVWVRRGRCGSCGATHALLPGFVVLNRLDVVESIGATATAVAKGSSGVRPAAKALGVPYTTARGWLRRLKANGARLAAGFSALAVELGGEVLVRLGDDLARAVAAIDVAWRAAMGLPGWLGVGRWRFCSSVCGGSLVAANMNSLYLVVGRRRFMPPAPQAGT